MGISHSHSMTDLNLSNGIIDSPPMLLIMNIRAYLPHSTKRNTISYETTWLMLMLHCCSKEREYDIGKKSEYSEIKLWSFCCLELNINALYLLCNHCVTQEILFPILAYRRHFELLSFHLKITSIPFEHVWECLLIINFHLSILLGNC